MNMQNIMREAQKMQKELQKTQSILENTVYEGSSSLVSVSVNGKKELLSIKINIEDSIEKDDVEILEDMIVVAVNDAVKKAEQDRKSKLDKYGHGLSGLI